MSIRFGKSIRIAKGLRLNVSKSGLGLSVGPRGASVSIGSRGVYANTGIPGTGISMRTKISSTSGNSVSSRQSGDGTSVAVKISIDEENGKETVWLESLDGDRIENEPLLRKIKKSEDFKAKLEETRLKTQMEIADKTEKLINIYHNSEKIITLEEIKNKIDTLKPEKYTVIPFSIVSPNRDNLLMQLAEESSKEVKTWKIWTLKKLRSEYVESRIENLFQSECQKWEKDKIDFDASEAKKEKNKNDEYFQQYLDEKTTLEKIIRGDDEYIKSVIENIFSEIQLPLDFSVNFQVSNSIVHLDIDLPEIENYPLMKSEILKSGKVSVKNKSQAEMYKDYAISVFGLAFFFTSIIFNISPAIKQIFVAGFTQRTNKKTGNIEDQYVYNINFERNKFSSINMTKIDPIEAVDNFENQKDISSKYELKTIILGNS